MQIRHVAAGYRSRPEQLGIDLHSLDASFLADLAFMRGKNMLLLQALLFWQAKVKKTGNEARYKYIFNHSDKLALTHSFQLCASVRPAKAVCPCIRCRAQAAKRAL